MAVSRGRARRSLGERRGAEVGLDIPPRRVHVGPTRAAVVLDQQTPADDAVVVAAGPLVGAVPEETIDGEIGGMRAATGTDDQTGRDEDEADDSEVS